MALTTLMHSSGISEFACLSVLAICCRKVFCSILSHSLIVARVPPQATGRDWLSWMPQPGGLGYLAPWTLLGFLGWEIQKKQTQIEIQIHNYIVCVYNILHAATRRVRFTWHLELSLDMASLIPPFTFLWCDKYSEIQTTNTNKHEHYLTLMLLW